MVRKVNLKLLILKSFYKLMIFVLLGVIGFNVKVLFGGRNRRLEDLINYRWVCFL